jgi:RNA polymerase sigma-70 factor (ECF subfamily)
MIDREAELKALMLAARQGGAAETALLLRTLVPPLRAFIRRHLNRHGLPDTEAEDILQDTLIAVHLKGHTYDASVPFTAWLHAIARYKLIDRWRAVARRPAMLEVEAADTAFAAEDHEAAMAARDLSAVLAHLPARTRALVEATRLEGLTMAEAAARTGMTETAARVAVHRALQRLAALFGGARR